MEYHSCDTDFDPLEILVYMLWLYIRVWLHEIGPYPNLFSGRSRPRLSVVAMILSNGDRCDTA